MTKNSNRGEFSHPSISVGNIVTDLEESVHFYTDIIGMKQTGEFSVDAEKAQELGLSDKKLDVTVLQLEESPDANVWKLIGLGKTSKKTKWINDASGMRYITIHVNHLQPFIQRIKKHGVKILSEEGANLGDDKYFVLIQDPDGTFIELIGPM